MWALVKGVPEARARPEERREIAKNNMNAKKIKKIFIHIYRLTPEYKGCN